MATPEYTAIAEALKILTAAGLETNLIPYNGNPDTVLTAAKGSLACDVTNGKLYINIDGATDWNPFEATIAGSSSGVTSTDVTLDTFAATAGDFVQWMVTAEGVSDSTQRYSCFVYASHDGSSAVKVQVVPILRHGSPALDLDVSVEYDSAGNINLLVNTDTAGGADVKWQRNHLI